MNRPMKKNKAFTLIELLVVTVMLSVVCLAIYSTFASGARIWQRVNRLSLNEDVNIFFDRFYGDAKNSIRFTGLRFRGASDVFELPTLTASSALGTTIPGLVVYTCAPGMLLRSQSDYTQVYQSAVAPYRHGLGGLQSCNFTYYQYDEEQKIYVWVEEWTSNDLPLAIRIDLTLGTGDDAQRLVKTVNIPLGGKKDNK
jgi:prepilin-type N-terminal cleavage/methylation domain-containing protein